ncbi:DUF2235 domain-containing protein [Pseudonocardia nigra]|uniref:DUF2235 domain-containing protein n=1 Tax=Pseudonocardia nigra TaxID=1921578 RepID=UPI001C5FC3E4|nr:DUF2235 domain-containing protein [Pseudonocardia nigra]
MNRNLVVCFDGTRNEPETGRTNVVRLYQVAVKDDHQIVYYDPGVGTMGARSATTRVGRSLTRVAGLVLGHGVRENVEEAYAFLMRTYRPGDRIFVFGFSRGAYTARALAGMLRTVGLLRAGADNLVPYALKLYARSGERDASPDEEKAFWRPRAEFADSFGNPAFPGRFEPQIEFLGVWDTVKSVGWLNWRAQLEQARWPFTRKLPNVRVGRHALAIDERRRPYREYRFDQEDPARADGRLREMWFAGVHSDVGGTFPDDHRLSDIALRWMLDEAAAAGLVIDADAYERHVGVRPGEELPPDRALGRIHRNRSVWGVLGWHRRRVLEPDEIHPSVRERIEATRGDDRPYRPAVPAPPVAATPEVSR